MSLQSTYLGVKGLIADNLESMGVDASSSDGLTTLAGKILDIEPSIGGLDLDTAVTLSVSSSTVTVGGSITCTATLTAEYDDETLVDVDLHGVLQNATIKLYEGSTLKTSATTNANGVATLTYTPTSAGTKTIKVVFDGTDNFNDCESATQTITVTQPTVGDVEITSTKSILSYADSDTATITATVLDDSSTPVPITGASVTIKVDGTTVKTANTDSNGEVSYTYTSTGAGDVTISAECMSVTETYSLEDCTFYDTNSYSTSSKTFNITLPTHFTLEYILKQTDSNNSAPYLDIGDSTNNRILIGQYARAGTNGLIVYKGGQTNYPYSTNPTFNAENTVWFKYDGTKYYYKLNNGVVMEVADANVTLTKLIHSESADGGYLKNIKIKPL